MKLKLLIFFLFFLLTYSLTHLLTYSLAARQRTRKPRAETVISTPRGVVSRVRLRPDHLGLIINFSNFDNLSSGRYELLYDTNGVVQGAGGSIILGDTDAKELLFGSCSGAVCTFHENVQNARLSIISVLKDGTTVLKPYRIKV